MTHSAVSGMLHGVGAPSPWLVRWAHLIAPGARVLDLACGHGRHTRWLAARGAQVTAIDRDEAALATMSMLANVTTLKADLEEAPWPLAERATFDAVVVTNYLHRPLLSRIAESVGPGGVLIYETFAQGNERYGKPSNPLFLLAPGELFDAARAANLRVTAYEDVTLPSPRAACVQRLCATRAAPGENPGTAALYEAGT
ncbi:class I SAM-dependent methyltransferase [Pandoraea apista]|uniref:Class I SAM-dependent methyltransferase n=1 Tax=Pandoraea apista TaxID=93218 RepID=A0ABX9ZWK3_9BURK|nr:class I SAM-dependent methyltransferase [Pandoraea apista]AJF01090.2 SAM-dependent methyltransferase [Pandoraea apista]AKH73535.1 SAM-dependent methyltransferase [Pandoraea apista]AKI62082.1 SAM-dependent methyltransferase [Pandoraea apista]PTE02915.1 class I SAM-dependent methyltransferase [Pandoraea apista]RRJ29916.1 class I SAM-dependent methyltransferase [Pandoraea apista]